MLLLTSLRVQNVGVAGQDAEEVPLMAVHVDSEEVVVLTVKDLSESKRTELVTALEICEGVKDVTLQVRWYPPL